MSDQNEVKIAEYNALRQEIIIAYEQQNNVQIFLITAFGVIAGFSLHVSPLSHLFFAFAFVVLWQASVMANYYSTKITRISAYIKIFLESEIEGLNWETKMRKYRNKADFKIQEKDYAKTIVAICAYIIHIFIYIEPRLHLLTCYHFRHLVDSNECRKTVFIILKLLIITMLPLIFSYLIWRNENECCNKKLSKLHSDEECKWEKLDRNCQVLDA